MTTTMTMTTTKNFHFFADPDLVMGDFPIIPQIQTVVENSGFAFFAGDRRLGRAVPVDPMLPDGHELEDADESFLYFTPFQRPDARKLLNEGIPAPASDPAMAFITTLAAVRAACEAEAYRER